MKLYLHAWRLLARPAHRAARSRSAVRARKGGSQPRRRKAATTIWPINPKGAVPALRPRRRTGADGSRCDPAIHRRQGAGKEAGARRWHARSATASRNGSTTSPAKLHKGIGQLFNPAMPEDYKRRREEGACREAVRRISIRRWRAANYLLGDFTVADGYAFTVLNWTNLHKIDLSAFPNIIAFMKRVADASGRAGCDEGGRVAEGGVNHAAIAVNSLSPHSPSKTGVNGLFCRGEGSGEFG